MRSLHRVYLGLVAGLVISACSSSNVGKACDKNSECGGDGLICDVHDGKGTCQEPHGHDAGDDTAHASEDTAHHATEDTAHHTTGTSTSTSGHDSEDTSHHDSEDTSHHDTEDTSHHDTEHTTHDH